MGWDERLFGAVFRAFQRARAPKRSAEEIARTVTLAEMKPRLAVLASACAGRAVEIVAAEGAGGARGAALALPEEMSFAPTRELNERAYVFRAVFSATTIRLGLSVRADASPAERCLATLRAVPQTLQVIAADLPGAIREHELLAAAALALRPSGSPSYLEALTQHLLGRGAEPAGPPRDLGAAAPPVPLWGELSSPLALAAPTAGAGAEDGGASGTERRGKPKDALRRVELGEEMLDENPLVHSFEKLHTADEYQGGKKRVDGSDELTDHAEALEELDLREVVRSRERARSLLRVDAMMEGSAGDLEGEAAAGGLPYDEWEERSRSYRKGWCQVFVSTAREAKDREEVQRLVRGVLGRHRSHVRSLREKLERIEARRAWRARQAEGPEVDVDAVVDREAALAAGHSGTDKLYRARRPHAPGLAVLVLVDASLSSDAWVDGHRVIDVAKESLVILGEALSSAATEVGIAAFHSNTRRDCRFLVVKGFSEPWSCAAPRLAPLEPAGYTRIGPALRHATTLLSRCDARRKLLILVSDGKPTDYDRYEGRYGVADVRRAVEEATRAGVRTFGLAIEKDAKPYLGRMFGPGGYEVLPRPELLPDALTRLTAELAG